MSSYRQTLTATLKGTKSGVFGALCKRYLHSIGAALDCLNLAAVDHCGE